MDQVAVVMAVFQPNKEFLREQIRTIAGQIPTIPRLVFVNADCVSETVIENLARDAGLECDVVTPHSPCDPVQAFEFGMSEALILCPDAKFFALADQDDVWMPDRLAKTIAAIVTNGADMAHSDAVLIDANGAEIGASVFRLEKRLYKTRPRDLLYRNSVTGMAMTMTRDLVERSLPFPRQDGVHYYHDLWLALNASVGRGIVTLTDRLVQYRQHGGNVIGAIPQADRHAGGYQRLRTWALNYGLARYLAEHLWARGCTHQDLQCFQGGRSSGGRFFRDAVSYAVRGQFRHCAIAFQFGCAALGRKVWAITHSLHHGRQAALRLFDQKLFHLSPGAPPAQAQVGGTSAPPKSWWAYFDGRLKKNWDWTLNAAMPRVQILVPTLNPSECFAGVKTALDFGRGLAERGYQVRFIATDLQIMSMANSRQFVLGLLSVQAKSRCEVICGVTAKAMAFHVDDRFVATAWWTAHVAQDLIKTGDFVQDRFDYLIQDYEPGFYPWGTEYATAEQSYDFDFDPIFNTTCLRDFFVTQIGLTFKDALVFRPSIDQALYRGLTRIPSDRRRIAVYGRPDTPRNLFEMTVEVLGHWIEQTGVTSRDVELISVGQNHADVELPNGLVLRSHGKLPWHEYPAFVASVDMALSLMLSPHPSHPPLEMALAGAKVVTNTYAGKDLSKLSANIYTAPANVPDLTDAMLRAWASVGTQNHAVDLSQLGDRFDDMLDKYCARQGPKRQVAT